MKKDEAYLLLLKPDRLLHRFHLYAGLPVKDSVYKGWESEGLSGHTMVQYLLLRTIVRKQSNLVHTFLYGLVVSIFRYMVDLVYGHSGRLMV